MIGNAVTTQPVVVLHGVKPVNNCPLGETKEVDFKTVKKKKINSAKGETKTEASRCQGQRNHHL